MSFNTTIVSAAALIPLSASYGYDDKMVLNPTLYQYDNGYSFFHHPLFTGTKDVKFANDSFFAITSAASFQTFIDDTTYIDPTELVIFTSFKASNGKYITNINNSLYATATSVGATEYFKIVKNINDGTCSISQNDLYATVVTDDHSFAIILEEKLDIDTNNTQKFTIQTNPTNDTFTIKTLFTIKEWALLYSAPIERFWSYYDDTTANVVKAIGMINDDDYSEENPYLFAANADLGMFAIGFDGKIIWVRYYNDNLNRFLNKTVDIKDIIENVEQNYLVEYPYKTKVDITNYQSLLKTGRIRLNIANLKNVLTPEYENAVKKE
jgi:hypothetical protein